MAAKRQSLGTGLDALLGLAEEGSAETAEAADLKEVDGSLKQLPLEFLQRGKYQPRRDLDADALKELASSCLLYTSPSPRDRTRSRMPSSA